MLQPIKTISLKEEFIKQFEKLILSGYFPVGTRVPPERTLAKQMGVSRPVVHEGLLELATKGLVSIKPRYGATINDYRRDGALGLLTTLFEFKDGMIDNDLFESVLDMRTLIEVETVRLAAALRSESNLQEFKDLIKEEQTINPSNTEQVTQLDFEFHHLIALASQNAVYPLLINSLKNLYTHLSGIFFENTDLVAVVFQFHQQITNAIEVRDVSRAEDIMREMLLHGECHLKDQIIELT